MRRGSLLPCLAAGLLAAGVASPLGVAPGSASAADTKVDLTGCLAPGGTPGDVRVFDTSQGMTLTETVLDVASKNGKSRTATVQAQLGSHTPTVRETITKPGKSMALGDVAVGDLSIEVKKPKRWYPLEAVPGRAYRTAVKGKAFRDGEQVGVARITGEFQVVGFEPLTTPQGTWSDTAHITVARAVSVSEGKDGAGIRQESDVELWCVDGVGVVAANYAFRFFENGELVGEVGDLDSWLVSATVDGVAVN